MNRKSKDRILSGIGQIRNHIKGRFHLLIIGVILAYSQCVHAQGGRSDDRILRWLDYEKNPELLVLIDSSDVVFRSDWLPVVCMQIDSCKWAHWTSLGLHKLTIPHYSMKSSSTANLYYYNKTGNCDDYIIIGIIDAGYSGLNTVQNKSIRLFSKYNIIEGSENVYCCSDHGSRVVSVLARELDKESARKPKWALYVSEAVSYESKIEEYQWIAALEHAEKSGIRLVNSSLNYTIFDDPKENYRFDQLDGKQSVMTKAAHEAARRGMLIVCSAGNEGQSNWQRIAVPCDADSILCVGAIDALDSVAAFSSRGPSADGRIKPDVVAPGVNISVLNRWGKHELDSGTSFAAPWVCALAARLWLRVPAATAMDVRDAILASCSHRLAPDSLRGYGLPNYDRALDTLRNACDASTWAWSTYGEQHHCRLFANPANPRLLVVRDRCGNVSNIKMLDSARHETGIDFSLADESCWDVTIESPFGELELLRGNEIVIRRKIGYY